MALTVPGTQTTERMCVRCGTWYSAEEVASGQAFRQDASNRKAWRGWRPICRPCEETVADVRKGANRWPKKVGATTRGHAEKLSKPRRGTHCEAWFDPDLTKDALISRYGWTAEQMAHDAEFQYANGCNYCHHPYAGMGHGVADITLDIFDPRLPPDYSTNTRWCCMTCQRRKGLLPPDKWAAKQRIYRAWEMAKALSAQARGMLF